MEGRDKNQKRGWYPSTIVEIRDGLSSTRKGQGEERKQRGGKKGGSKQRRKSGGVSYWYGEKKKEAGSSSGQKKRVIKWHELRRNGNRQTEHEEDSVLCRQRQVRMGNTG